MNVKEPIQELASNPKVAGSVAGITAALGAAMESAIDWIPDDIGKLATLVSVSTLRHHAESRIMRSSALRLPNSLGSPADLGMSVASRSA